VTLKDKLIASMPPSAVGNVKQRQISALKTKLTATDYKAIKYAEGLYSDEEYAPTKAERQALREQIRALEAEISAEEGGEQWKR
jgi:hypothetical protein